MMAPTKQSKPAFSPPRPGKSKSKPQARRNGISKAANSESTKKRGRPSKTTSKPTTTTSKRRRHSSPSDLDSDDNSAPDDAPSPSHSASDSEPAFSQGDRRSPSPDHVLVEAVPDPTTTATDTHIPNSLLHHILNQQLTRPETKIKKDAWDLLGVYVDTFVREAIIRCAFERGEQDGGGAEREGAGVGVGSEGWLEVSDLERVGAQLVLDF